MSESLVEKIKQEGKTFSDLEDLLVKTLDNNEEFEKLEKAKWIKTDVVLKILSEQQEKLQELADLLKTRPKLDEIFPINKMNSEVIYQFLMKREKCFEKIEKKFVELSGLPKKKEKPT